jgi:microcin C transport system permease protein
MTGGAPPAAKGERLLWWRLKPTAARRLAALRANKRGMWSLRLFALLVGLSLFSNFIANERPILVWYDGGLYLPAIKAYPETAFGGEFETETDYTDPFVQASIRAKGWMIWPLIPYSYDTLVLGLSVPSPSPPSARNWLGTDNQARDVVARVLYGFRVSVLFGLALTALSAMIGVVAGAVQGYFGGRTDLYLQRFIEIWDSVPILFLLIIISGIVEPNFWWLLLILLLFTWMSLTGLVRAEYFRARNFDYVRAARALGAGNASIMFRHILPNAMVATITFVPFMLAGAILSLTALDFLGFGLPPGSASLGELLQQGKANLNAPWLGLTAIAAIALILVLVVFIGEAVRDAFDPRKAVLPQVAAEEPPASPTPPAAAPAPRPVPSKVSP